MDDLVGQQTRGYQIGALLGKGGFGAVYRAFQPAVGREVAIKIILPEFADQPEFIRRFETEARLVARLEHPFIVPLFDYWREPGSAYLVMRFLRGGSLRDRLKEGRYDPKSALMLIEQIAGALAVAHRNKVIHRDLKPDNILLDEEGNTFLSDFGIAKDIGNQSAEQEEGISGSPGYMSPEQITGSPVTPQTDIYSLAIMLYELLTGQHPFGRISYTEIIHKHLNQPVPDLDFDNTEIPWDVNAIIQKASAKDPSGRYQDVMAFARALKDALAEAPDLQFGFTLTDEELEAIQNPYKGLRAFEEADSVDFFGREALVSQLVGRLAESEDRSRFLAVVGPSGSGKSSVVKAGLIPALRWGDVPNSENWYITEMVPGDDPLGNLETALLSVATGAEIDLKQTLQHDQGLLSAARQILPEDADLLLVIDQFEEVFTLAADEEDTVRFLAIVREAVEDSTSNIRIIATLRADFYDRPLLYEGFGNLMRARTEVVLPLSPNELERAIIGPAERVGLIVDSNLLAAIVADVREEPGALPLLQYVMTEVFERREDRYLTLQAYRDSGGVRGALARRAGEIYQALSPDQQSITRQLFLRLVTLGEGAEDTRRRVHWAELISFGIDTGRLQTVLDVYGKHRLLSFDRDPQTREPTVEVAHEALIREWSKLREWLDASRDDVRLQRSLAAASNEWLGSGEDASFLLRGNRLAQYEEWKDETDLALTDLEKRYLAASIAQRKALEAEEAARRARELQLERHAKNRLRNLVVVLGIAFVIAVVLTMFALRQRETAEEERDKAQIAQAIALREASVARSLAQSATAEQLQSSGNRRLALRLALEANAIEDPPEQSQRVLADLAYVPGLIRKIDGTDGGHTAAVTDIAYNGDGTMLASASDDGSVRIWDTATWSVQHVLLGHDLPLSSVGFHPYESWVLSGSSDQTLILWDANTGEQIRRLRGHDNVVYDVTISPDGLTALSGSTNSAILWDLATGEERNRYDVLDNVFTVVFHPDGQTALAATGRDSFVHFDLATGAILNSFNQHGSNVLGLSFSPDGRTIAASTRGSVILWDADSGTRLLQLNSDGIVAHPTQTNVNDVAISPSGTTLVSVSDSGAEGNTILLRSMNTGEIEQVFEGFEGDMTSVAFSPDGRQMVTGSTDHSLLVWSVANDAVDRVLLYGDSANTAVLKADETGFAVALSSNEIILLDLVTMQSKILSGHDDAVLDLAFDPDGRTLFSVADDGTIIQWDVESGEMMNILKGHTEAVSSIDYADDGTFFVTGSDDSSIIVWDADSLEVLYRLEGHERRVLDVAISPDSSLILSGGADRTLKLWDAKTGEWLRDLAGHERRITGVAFSPDSNQAVSASDDGALILWNLGLGAPVRTMTTNTDSEDRGIFSVDFSSDGRRVVSGGENGQLILWDAVNGAILRVYRSEMATDEHTSSRIVSAKFNRDNTQVLTAMTDGRVIIWHTPDLPALLDWVQANRYVPELTCEQRDLYRVAQACDDLASGLSAGQ